MNIMRCGSGRFEGWKNIEIASDNVSWHKEGQAVLIKARSVKDFGRSSHHDYEVYLSLDDIVQILNCIGEEGVDESIESIEEAMKASLRALIRLLNAASGLFESEK